MFDVHDCVSFLSNRGAKLIGESLNEYFGTDSVTRVQWTAMYHIDRSDGLSQRDLANLMMIKDPTALHLIDRLERDGLVSKEINPDNRRSRVLKLTEKGKAVLDEKYPTVVRFNEDARKGISDEELQTFKSVMDRMIENVSRDSEK